MNPVEIASKLAALAAEHPEAVNLIGQTVEHVANSSNPVETARRAALATLSAQGSEEALKRILGRSA